MTRNHLSNPSMYIFLVVAKNSMPSDNIFFSLLYAYLISLKEVKIIKLYFERNS